ncbi:hypothetical protein [Desulfovibrio sp. ZJ369]|uniref:hypothetical protein n=1 Tax=Desulfovibrio sp. ZJ369 TaxID=2709793 RepID=UPI0013E9F09B|nr:hypothetical protein [Desulfovibrio sp. ZJ369]
MKGLTECIISFFDLLEAEGQLLRHNVLRTLRMALLLALGLLFGVAAVAFFVAALYKALSLVLHPAWVLCIIGLICAGIAGGLLWMSLPKKKTTA